MYSPSILSFFFSTTILLVFYHLKCEARDSINVSNPLNGSGDTLVSAGNRFELGFFTPPGNEKGHRYVGIWYYKLSPSTIVWIANRDNPVSDSCGAFGIAEDGNLKIWCNNEVLFSVTELEKSTTSNRTLQLSDSGNLVLFDGRTRLWQSFDLPTDTFLPGMKINDNMMLTSWISPSEPGTGYYTFHRDRDVYSIRKRSTAYRESDKLGHVGLFLYNELPIFVAQMLSGYEIRLNQNTYNYSYYNNSRLLMNSSGEIQYYHHSLADGGRWSILWKEPQDSCSIYDGCGKFAICDIYYEPMCQCLPGFTPASPGKYSEGCERESICSRPSQDEGFLNLKLTKIVGQVISIDWVQEEPFCKQECLNNCTCEAYMYTASNSETGNSVAKCQIWTSDLVNLQNDYTDHGLDLSLRVPFSSKANSASRICQPCVARPIPYPLSIEPNCGDPLYSRFHCTYSTGEINFIASRSKYHVVSINPEKHRFVILVYSERALICNDKNLSDQMEELNQSLPSLPFYVTNWCYSFSAKPEIRSGNLVELGWKPPLEPICSVPVDCKDWPNSDCQDQGNGQRRCYCNQGYRWDNSSVNCTGASANNPSASANLGKGSTKNKLQTRYIIVLTILLVGVILGSTYILHWRRRMVEGSGNQGSTEAHSVLFSYEHERQLNDLMHEKEKGIDIPFYDLGTILSATDNFSDANKLGRGGFGPVYKGKFPGGHEIAVKRLSSCSSQGIDEFLNEVILIAKLQHRNLVRLLGYCIKGNEKILLYEYMPNRSLDALIFDPNDSLLLDWKKRFDIILGIARGLLYLHQDSRLRIIHRDLKTSNILLDEEMNPKISDFGLARIIEGKRTEASTNKVVGTFGYMSPEYALDGKFSIKSDVFSFGVVMLEIISGKKNTGFYNPQEVMNLLGYAWRLWSENKTLDLVDPRLMESCEKSQVMTCINVGLLCVQEDPNDRPSMSTVVIMLGSENTALPTPTQPAFVFRRRTSSIASSSSSTKPDTISNNELTISMAQGR